MNYIIAIDQGTSSSRCIVYDREARPIAVAQREFTQHFPRPGWVEHDAEEIWQTQIEVVRQAMRQTTLQAHEFAGIGITNQRETVVVWNRKSGKPICPAIVWQDRRTADTCSRLKADGLEPTIQAKTGLIIDPYFSASKIRWILDHVEGARDQAERGELAFGTVDSWLVWNLTLGQLHITDASNAARTQLYNIERMRWDEELLDLFDIPISMLPTVKTTSEIYGETHPSVLNGAIPIAAIAGDQQAALFGQLCIEPGMAKCTYGTGSFLIMNTGPNKILSKHRLLTTVAWQMGNEVTYALEGSVFTAGSVVQWLRDGLQLFEHVEDSESLAGSVDDNGGIYFVPALTGLGAPHWDPDARGTLFGITRGTTRAHITRAALESIGFQINDLLQSLADDSGLLISQLKIDGGAAKNNLVAQFQADISRIEIIRPLHLESTALGAAYLAGLAVGFWTIEELKAKWQTDRTFHGTMPLDKRKSLTQCWLKAVAKAKHWVE